MNRSSWSTYLSILNEALGSVSVRKIESVLTLFRKVVGTNKTIWVIGNGGSAATASHFCVDLSKGCAKRIEKTIRAIPLMDLVPIQSAWSNDNSYGVALEMSLRNFACSGDIVFAISGSGNSINILNSLRAAKELGLDTIGLTGFKGGKMSSLVNLEINVPSNDMQIIEDAHHAICHYISREI
jgi:D-sedoheptulose 7-phosphate isomerase